MRIDGLTRKELLDVALCQIREETGLDDWRDRARACMRATCALVDDNCDDSGVPWYVWMQDFLDELYAELEIKRAPELRG